MDDRARTTLLLAPFASAAVRVDAVRRHRPTTSALQVHRRDASVRWMWWSPDRSKPAAS